MTGQKQLNSSDSENRSRLRPYSTMVIIHIHINRPGSRLQLRDERARKAANRDIGAKINVNVFI